MWARHTCRTVKTCHSVYRPHIPTWRNPKHLSTTAADDVILSINDEDDFSLRVLKSSKPVLVDFYADWCGPCKQLTPTLESLVKADKTGIKLAKINVDDMQEVAMEYNVSSIPHVVLIVNGKSIDKFIGSQPEEQIKTWLASALSLADK